MKKTLCLLISVILLLAVCLSVTSFADTTTKLEFGKEYDITSNQTFKLTIPKSGHVAWSVNRVVNSTSSESSEGGSFGGTVFNGGSCSIKIINAAGNEVFSSYTGYGAMAIVGGYIDTPAYLLSGTYDVTISVNYTTVRVTAEFFNSDETYTESYYVNNNSLENADEIALTDTVKGCLGVDDDEDYYKLVLPEKCNISVNMLSQNGSVSHARGGGPSTYSYHQFGLELLDSNGNKIGPNTTYYSSSAVDHPNWTGGVGDQTRILTYSLNKGVYYLKVNDWDICLEPFYSLNVNLILPEMNGLKVAGTYMNCIKLGWDKLSGVTGYSIQQKVDGAWTKIANTTANAYAVSNLKSGAKQFFRVRPYRIIDGTVYYGDWSYINGYTNGWMKLDGNYYYHKNNALVKGWQNIANYKGVSYKYYFNSKGVMLTGWQSIKNSKGVAYKYYFGDNGYMRTGWQSIKNSKGVAYKYYFGSNGIMRTNWQWIENSKGVKYRYYFGSNGYMRTGWQKIANSKGVVYKYYFFSNGVNAINRNVKIGNKTYKFNKYGVCLNP